MCEVSVEILSKILVFSFITMELCWEALTCVDIKGRIRTFLVYIVISLWSSIGVWQFQKSKAHNSLDEFNKWMASLYGPLEQILHSANTVKLGYAAHLFTGNSRIPHSLSKITQTPTISVLRVEKSPVKLTGKDITHHRLVPATSDCLSEIPYRQSDNPPKSNQKIEHKSWGNHFPSPKIKIRYKIVGQLSYLCIDMSGAFAEHHDGKTNLH